MLFNHETCDDDTSKDGDGVPVNISSRRNDTLFYCRCESVKPVSILLSCLRQFAARAGAGSCNNDHGSMVESASMMAEGGKSAKTRCELESVRSESNTRRSPARQQATVYASAGGLTVIVRGMAHQSQVSVDIHSGLFSEFIVSEERIPLGDHENDVHNCDVPPQKQQHETIQGGQFSINLTTFLESLDVLGTTPKDLERIKLFMSYDRTEAILRIELEDCFGVLATSAVIGSVPDFEHEDADDDDDIDEDGGGGGARDSSLAGAFRRSPVVARVIVKSNYFKAAVAELAEVAGASCCTIVIATNYMELGTVGHGGECLVHLPKSSEAFVSLVCKTPSSSSNKTITLHSRSYNLRSLLQGMRGLDIAHETCISMNGNGVIAIQHQVLDPLGHGDPNFIDFLMTAVEEENYFVDHEHDNEMTHAASGDELRSGLGGRRLRPLCNSYRRSSPSQRSAIERDANEESSAGEDEDISEKRPGSARESGQNASKAQGLRGVTSPDFFTNLTSSSPSSPQSDALSPSSRGKRSLSCAVSRPGGRRQQQILALSKSLTMAEEGGECDEAEQDTDNAGDEANEDQDSLTGSQSPELLFGGTSMQPDRYATR